MDTRALQIEPIDTRPIVLSTHIEPWERQPNETDLDWSKFIVYRDLYPSERSLVRVARIVSGNEELSHTPNEYSTTAKINRWDERAIAYDRWRDANMRQKLEERELERRLAAADLADELLAKVAEAANAILAAVEVEYKDADGNPTGKKGLVSKLSAADISNLSNVALKLREMAYGKSEQQQGVHIHGNAMFQIGDNQLVRRAEEVVDERRKVIDSIPFDVIRSGSDSSTANVAAGRSDVD